MKISHEEFLRLMRYEPDSGQFIRLVSTLKFKAGEEAGRRDISRPFKNRGGIRTGYWMISIRGRSYPRARLAWFYMTGEWPKEDIDHKDRDPMNDRWVNLRKASRALNNANRIAFSNSRLSLKGVHKRGNKYRAMISIEGKNCHLGYFDTKEMASDAYKIAASAAFGDFHRQL